MWRTRRQSVIGRDGLTTKSHATMMVTSESDLGYGVEATSRSLEHDKELQLKDSTRGRPGKERRHSSHKSRRSRSLSLRGSTHSRSRRTSRDSRKPASKRRSKSRTKAMNQSANELKNFLSEEPATRVESKKAGRRGRSRDSQRDCRSGTDAEDEATIATIDKKKRKAERQKLREITQDRMKKDKEVKKGSNAASENQPSSLPQTNADNGEAAHETAHRDARMMLRQPSKRFLSDGDHEASESSSSYSVEYSQSELGTTSLGNIGIMSTDANKDEDAGTVLQFDPTSMSGNVFTVKQVYNSGSECEVNNADGSHSFFSISEIKDPMSEAQQHRPPNQPIFDFLEDEAAGNQNNDVSRPDEKVRNQDNSSSSKKERKKLSLRDTMLVEDAQNYTHFFDADKEPSPPLPVSPYHNPHSSWPPPVSKQTSKKSSSSKRKGKKKSKSKLPDEAEKDGTIASSKPKSKKIKSKKPKRSASRKKTSTVVSDSENEGSNYPMNSRSPPRSKSDPLQAPSSRNLIDLLSLEDDSFPQSPDKSGALGNLPPTMSNTNNMQDDQTEDATNE